MTDAGPRQVTRVSAYAICLDEANRLLLCRIAPGGSVGFDGWWTLPGGGLDHGEDPRDATLRELSEETGLIGALDDLQDEIDGSTDTCRWFLPDKLRAERLVDIAELAARRIGLIS